MDKEVFLQKSSVIRENIKITREKMAIALQKAGRKETDAQLMAVTKTVDPELINVAIDEGILLLGENRVQEYLSKKDIYRKEAEVQFIGALQTNKVRQIIDSVTLIHSVDRISLAEEIQKQAEKIQKIQKILIEVNIGDEDSKSGISSHNLMEIYKQFEEYPNLSVKGIMTIPPRENASYHFAQMQELFERLKQDHPEIDTLSMGMSGDFETALTYGSTLVRIGSGLFGARPPIF